MTDTELRTLDKELRKLSRAEQLELLLDCAKEIERLRQEIEAVKRKAEENLAAAQEERAGAVGLLTKELEDTKRQLLEIIQAQIGKSEESESLRRELEKSERERKDLKQQLDEYSRQLDEKDQERAGLKQELEALGRQKEELERRLADRSIAIGETGSIAEAAVRITGLLTAAQEAADLYLENARRTYNEEAKAQYEEFQEKYKAAEERVAAMERETREKCLLMLQEARKRSETPAADGPQTDPA